MITNTRAIVYVHLYIRAKPQGSEFSPVDLLVPLVSHTLLTSLNFAVYFHLPQLPISDALAKMPSTTSDRKVQSRIRATNVARGARMSSGSSDTSPERGETNQSTSLGPDDLDQPWPYQFKVRETVWVRIQEDGMWCQGTIVSSQTMTDKVREGAMGKYWRVNVRNDGKTVSMKLSPQNGDIKPDNKEIRDLLRINGFLESE